MDRPAALYVNQTSQTRKLHELISKRTEEWLLKVREKKGSRGWLEGTKTQADRRTRGRSSGSNNPAQQEPEGRGPGGSQLEREDGKARHPDLISCNHRLNHHTTLHVDIS